MKQRWLYTGGYAYIEDFALETGIDYHPEYEPDMKNKTWVQDGRNQKAIFDTFFEEFSYASEHLSYDAIIDVILQSIKSMNVIKECGIEGNWDSIRCCRSQGIKESVRGFFESVGYA